MWIHFFEHNFFPVFSLLCLLVFFVFNPMLEKRYTKYFILSSVIIFLLVGCEACSCYFEQFVTPNVLLYISTAFTFALYPFVMLFLVFISINLNKTGKIFISIPAIINAVICVISIFTPLVFKFGDKNEIVSGILGYLPHSTALFYLLTFTIHSFVSVGKGKKSKIVVLSMLVILIGGALALDTFVSTKLLITAMALSLIAYFIYLLAINYSIDVLTGAYTRRVFYLDSKKKKNNIVAVMLIDVNGLKLLNDGKGHKEGDIGLKTVCSCCEKCLTGKNRIYRIGGDEFVILCINYPRDNVMDLSYKIIDSISETPYRVALGLAFLQNGETVESAIQRADVEMYADKMKYKQENMEN